MVFPASPAPDAHAATALKTRLELILRLADAGVLVLIDQGKPEQLGTFVRTVLQIDEHIEVLTSAYGLTNIAPGSSVILLPNVRECAWMNLERPLLAHRRLRVLMYCDNPESAEIARGAPDFFHWISHWMEAPRGVWPPALLGLRAAAKREVPIAWEGSDFDIAFVTAFGDTKRVTLSAAIPYSDLVQAFQTEAEWIVLTDVDGPFRGRRVYWAMAESGRKGKLVVLQPKGHIDGFARVTSTPMRPKDAEAQLTNAGMTKGAKLAAILDCEAEAIELAARLLSSGVNESDCLAVWRDEDPGAALVKLAESRGIEVPKDATCVMRANGTGAGVVIGDLIAAAEEAFDARDIEISALFLRRKLAMHPGDVRALIMLGSTLEMQGRRQDAIATFKQALVMSGGPTLNDASMRIMAMMAMSAAHRAEIDFGTARRNIDAALKELKRLPEAMRRQWRPALLTELAQVLKAQGDIDGAKRTAMAVLKGSSNQELVLNGAESAAAYELLGRIYFDLRDLPAAREAIGNALRMDIEFYGEEHKSVAVNKALLGQIELEAGNIPHATELLQQAVTQHRQLEPSSIANMLTLLARAYRAAGNLDAAEKNIEEAYYLMEREGSSIRSLIRAEALHTLAVIRFERGQLDEARAYFEEAIRTVQHAAAADISNPIRIATIELSYGQLLISLDEFGRGLDTLHKAHRTLLNKLGPKHKLTQDAADLLSRIPPIPE